MTVALRHGPSDMEIHSGTTAFESIPPDVEVLIVLNAYGMTIAIAICKRTADIMEIGVANIDMLERPSVDDYINAVSPVGELAAVKADVVRIPGVVDEMRAMR